VEKVNSQVGSGVILGIPEKTGDNEPDKKGPVMQRVLIAGLSLCLLSLTCGSAVSATYGALAVVPGQGRDFHGFGTGHSSKAAQRAAIAQCGNGRCKIVITYVPGQCAHIALGIRQIFWNNKLFSQREKEFTLAACNRVDADCEMIQSECFAE
jgi:hypothetical protein